MRLIDADKLNLDICIAKSLNKAESTYDYAYSEKMIEKAQTIEAVPIDWLKRVNSLCGQETRLQEAIDLWESKGKENEKEL